MPDYDEVARDYNNRVKTSTQQEALQATLTKSFMAAMWELYRWSAGSHVAGEVWVKPINIQEAYADGAIVTHNGKTWESTVNFNVWTPGGYGWVAK